jgi:hypothetical protein
VNGGDAGNKQAFSCMYHKRATPQGDLKLK